MLNVSLKWEEKVADQNNLRKGPKLPSGSNPTPKVEPGRIESIGPDNLKNNVKEALKKGLIFGGAEGLKQKEDEAKTNSSTTEDHILK